MLCTFPKKSLYFRSYERQQLQNALNEYADCEFLVGSSPLGSRVFVYMHGNQLNICSTKYIRLNEASHSGTSTEALFMHLVNRDMQTNHDLVYEFQLTCASLEVVPCRNNLVLIAAYTR